MSVIYLDNAATTRPFPGMEDLVHEYTQDLWYNPSAVYSQAVFVRKDIENARENLLSIFGSSHHDCVFTSGGTESAAMVIRNGVKKRKGMNYVCGAFEHPCVEENFHALRNEGAEVRFVPVLRSGLVDREKLLDSVDVNTALVSVGHVNNETGALNNIADIAAQVHEKAPNALFHADGVQAFLRVPISGQENIDYYTVSAHKVHGLKGTGAVFYRKGTPLKQLLPGGGQERGLRSGTENVLGILAFSKATEWLQSIQRVNPEAVADLRRLFLARIAEDPSIEVVSPDEEHAAPHIVSLAVSGVRGETLMHSLETEGIIISMGSACSSKKGRGRIAKILDIPEKKASEIVRISFSTMNRTEDVLAAADAIVRHADALRQFNVSSAVRKVRT